MVRVIAFDFFGVLCPPMYGGILHDLFPHDDALRNSWMQIVEHDLDGGKITEDEFVARLAQSVGRDPEKLKADSYQYAKINNSLLAYIKELKPNYKIGLLTNAPSSIIYNVLKENITLFDIPVISGDIYMTKPDPKIFLHFVEKAQTPVSDIFFTDDNPKNIEVAHSLGMHGSVFQTVKKLTEDLAALGVRIK